jgi:hypothetical protein
MLRRRACALLCLALGTGCPADDPPPGTGSSSDASESGTTEADTTATGTITLDGTIGTTSEPLPTTGSESGSSDDTGPAPLPARLGATADWLARTLSVLDLDAIAAGATTREEIVVRTIDLADYAPGPLEVELTPDGRTAVVAVSPGFFGGLVGNLIGAADVEQAGTLLVIDLETEAVTELATAHVPMGIAIVPDGSLAYTANFGTDDEIGSTLSIVDLAALAVIEEIELPGRPEQVSLHVDGTLGIVNLDGLGAVQLFETSDPAGTLSVPLLVGADPSDVDFVPGTQFAVVANSLDPSNIFVIDASDPSMPTEAVEGPSPLGASYAVTPIPGQPDVLFTASDFSSGFLQRYTIEGDGTPTLVWETAAPTPGSFALGVAVDEAAGLAIMALPGANVLSVQDLEGGEPRLVPWQDDVGPTYVAVAPSR